MVFSDSLKTFVFIYEWRWEKFSNLTEKFWVVCPQQTAAMWEPTVSKNPDVFCPCRETLGVFQEKPETQLWLPGRPPCSRLDAFTNRHEVHTRGVDCVNQSI